jgi:prepilin-type N-terminal cleavage/methylation domain-containing protein
MKPRKNCTKSGFSLIEVIVTLVIVAIVAVMIATFFNKSITQSSVPIARLNTSARLNEAIELITAQYTRSPQWTPNTPYAAGAIILPPTLARTGLQYTTAAACTSGITVPNDWLQASVSDNTCTWTPNGAAPSLINQAWRSGKQYYKNAIIVSGAYQYVSKIGTGIGTTGSNAPTWTSATTIGSTVPPPVPPDAVTWQFSGAAPTIIMQTLIGGEGTDVTQTLSGKEVSYRVIENRFIKFVDGANLNDPKEEQNIDSSPGDAQYGMYLKVTLGHRSDASDRTSETISTLFAIR